MLAERARERVLAGPALASALAGRDDLAGIDLSGAHLDGASLAGVRLFKACLDGASLRGADLSGAELSGASLRGANLQHARLVGAGLGMADLTGAKAFETDFTHAVLTGATLAGATLTCAVFRDSRMRESDLRNADLHTADLRGAELSGCDVSGASFDEADLRSAKLQQVKGYRSAEWFGADLRDINFTGAYRLQRYVADENYIHEFRHSGRLQRILYWIWWATSDCGRSVGRWLIMISLMASVFAAAYAWVGVELGRHAPSALTYYYFSVVTLTTLGYGDILPTSSMGQILVLAEVGLGYMMLGGLISIFANKMARRAD